MRGGTIDLEELKRIQFDMLLDIDHFCRNNGIRYSLAYGTLLGAARHGGYIPWDDDIDICMPRPDYERFISMYSGREGVYKCYSTKTFDSYMLPFAKVSDERTQMREAMYEKDLFGIYIDVFPVDAMGSKLQVFKSKWLIRFLNAKKAVMGKRSILKDFIIGIGKLLLLPISVSKILGYMENVALEYQFGKTPMCEIFCSSTVEREMAPTALFMEYQDITFEGVKFRSVRRFEDYLTILFGDWQQLPPKEKRVSTHLFKAWWKT